MAVKKYKITQFPINKDFDNILLSIEQRKLRTNKIHDHNQKEKICDKCLKQLPITEFYAKRNPGTKQIKRRDNACRDCRMKAMGVIEIGKQRFAMKIFDKNFRRCSVCKNIKPLTKYTKSKSCYGGYSNNCYECSVKLHLEFTTKQRKEIGDFHVRQYGIKKYKIIKFTKSIIEKLRNEIEQNRKPKYFLDGKNFCTLISFAEYILGKYFIPITTTTSRISQLGYTEKDCILSEKEARSIAYTKGKIKVIDMITDEIFMFKNTRDNKLLKMFGYSTIIQGIKTGNETRITKLSKYKNPCVIKRMNKCLT